MQIEHKTSDEVRLHRIAVSAVFFIAGAEVAIWAVMVPLIRLKLALDEAELAKLLLLFGLGSVLAVPIASLVLKRYSHHKVMRVFGLLGILGLGVVALMPDQISMGVAIWVTGICVATTDIAMNANAVDVEAAAGKPIISSIHGWFSAGGMLGIIFGPLAAILGLRWMASVGVVSLAITFVFFQRYLLGSRPPLVEEQPNRERGLFSNIGWVIVVLAIANMTGYSMEGAVVDWSGVYFEKDLAASPTFYGLGFSGFSVAMAGMRFSGDFLRSRLGNKLLVVLSCLTGSAAYWVVSVSSSIWMATLGYALLGLGLANLVPILFVMAARVPGISAGSGIAVVAGMGYIGLLGLPPIIGFAARVTSLSTVFSWLSLTLLAAAFVVFAFPEET